MTSEEKNHFLEEHLHLVEEELQCFQKYIDMHYIDNEDLYQAGVYGLILACDTYYEVCPITIEQHVKQFIRRHMLMELKQSLAGINLTKDEFKKVLKKDEFDDDFIESLNPYLNNYREKKISNSISVIEMGYHESEFNLSMKEILKSLPERNSEIYNLYLSNTGYEDIAKVFGLSRKAVMRIINDINNRIKREGWY